MPARKKRLTLHRDAVKAYEDKRGITTLLEGSAPIVLRATQRKLDVGTEPVPVWVQIAEEGEYKGHASGEFELDAKVFGDIVRNFRAHPSYRAENARTPWVAEGDNIDCGRVIPWDFHHANEAAPSSVAVSGAPAQGWVLELDVRTGEAGLELWALTDWLEPARTYIRQGSYQWSSVAIWPDSHDAKTNKPIGTYLSSVAITNDPFIQGMQPLAASRRARDLRKADRGPSLNDLQRQLNEALEKRYPAAPGDFCGVYVCDVYDATCVFEWDGKYWELSYTFDGKTVALGAQPTEVERTYAPIASTTPATEAATAGRRRIAASRGSATDTRRPAMNGMQKIATILGLSNAVILAAREDDAVSLASLEAAVQTAAEDKMAALKAAIAQLTQIVSSMGAPEGAPAAAVAGRVAELVQAEAELKKIQPEIAALKVEQAKAEEASIEADVDNAIAAHRLNDATKPAMLYMRKADKAAFLAKYPIGDLPAGMPHITRSLVTDDASNVRTLSVVRGPEAGPLELGNKGKAGSLPITLADLAMYEGRNDLERIMSFLQSKNPSKQFTRSDLHEAGCKLLTQLRQAS